MLAKRARGQEHTSRNGQYSDSAGNTPLQRRKLLLSVFCAINLEGFDDHAVIEQQSKPHSSNQMPCLKEMTPRGEILYASQCGKSTPCIAGYVLVQSYITLLSSSEYTPYLCTGTVKYTLTPCFFYDGLRGFWRTSDMVSFFQPGLPAPLICAMGYTGTSRHD